MKKQTTTLLRIAFTLLLTTLLGCYPSDDCDGYPGFETTTSGKVVDNETLIPISNCTVTYEGLVSNECENRLIEDEDTTDSTGNFSISSHEYASEMYKFTHEEYESFGTDALTDTVRLVRKGN